MGYRVQGLRFQVEGSGFLGSYEREGMGSRV